MPSADGELAKRLPPEPERELTTDPHLLQRLIAPDTVDPTKPQKSR